MSLETSPPQTIVIQPKESLFGRFGKVLVGVVLLLVLALVGMSTKYQAYFSEPGGPQEKYHSLSKQIATTDKVAVITVSDTIMEGNNFPKQQIDLVRKDDHVKALVLRINSPGGTVTYSDYLLHHLKELKAYKADKLGEAFPVVVSMGSLCASGGYYIAMAVEEQEDAIFAEPTTWTGSIGVIIPHYEITGMMDQLGISEDSIASGEFKQMGSPTKEMTPEQRELFQTLVDQTYNRFREVVMSGRPAFREDPAALDAVAKGQIFTAEQAQEKGLVDQIGFIEEAVARAVELAGLDEEKVRCVKYQQPTTPFDALMSAQASRIGLGELRAMLNLSAPRAYYLYTTLPALVRAE